MTQRTLRNKLYVGVDHRRTTLVNQAVSRGASWQTLRTKPFQLPGYITPITSGVEGRKPVRVNKDKQLLYYKRIFVEPFKKPYIYCISGATNDSQAKLVALRLMIQALSIHNQVRESNGDEEPHPLNETLSGRDLPLWHTLLGGFGDKLRDTKAKPSLLVLSNVTVNSTQTKLEKLRDILELYGEIPRIVVTTGTDPISFFRRQLFYPLHFSAYLTVNREVL